MRLSEIERGSPTTHLGHVGEEGTGIRSYSRKTRLKVKTLYIVHGLAPKEIAEKVGIRAQSVSNLVHKNGWAEERRKRETLALARAEDRAAAEAAEFTESVIVQSQELAEKGFHMARETGDAKDFAMAAKGTQVFVQLARQGMGIDSSGAAANARGAASAFVFMRFGEAPKETEKSVQPIDVSATETEPAEMTLDFEQSQQGETERAESAQLIGNRTQVVENLRAS